FHVLHAVLLGSHAGLLRGHLGGKRGALAGAAETTATRSRPGKRVSLAIGDRDDGVVEARMDVRDRIEHVLARLLRLLGARAGGARSGSRGAGGALCLLISHITGFARTPHGDRATRDPVHTVEKSPSTFLTCTFSSYALPGGAFNLTACLRGP